MSYSGGIVSKPVTTYDIGSAIGSASRDVGTLCTHSNINIWAKYKPFRSSITREATKAEHENANFGLGVMNGAKFSLFQNVADIVVSPNTTWQYFKPRGASYNEWYRMLDFNHYRADAKAPGYENHTKADYSTLKALAYIYTEYADQSVDTFSVEMANMGVIKNPRLYGAPFDKEAYVYAVKRDDGALFTLDSDGTYEYLYDQDGYEDNGVIQVEYQNGGTNNFIGLLLPLTGGSLLRDYAIVIPGTYFHLDKKEQGEGEVIFISTECDPDAWTGDRITRVLMDISVKNGLTETIYPQELLLSIAEGDGSYFTYRLFTDQSIPFDSSAIAPNATKTLFGNTITLSTYSPYRDYFLDNQGWWKLSFKYRDSKGVQTLLMDSGNWRHILEK